MLYCDVLQPINSTAVPSTAACVGIVVELSATSPASSPVTELGAPEPPLALYESIYPLNTSLTVTITYVSNPTVISSPSSVVITAVGSFAFTAVSPPASAVTVPEFKAATFKPPNKLHSMLSIGISKYSSFVVCAFTVNAALCPSSKKIHDSL